MAPKARPSETTGRYASFQTKSRRPAKRRSNPKSERLARVEVDENYEAQIQDAFSPSPDTSSLNVSTRTIPLSLKRRRDPANVSLPTLSHLASLVAAKNFATHILPNRETFSLATAASVPSRSRLADPRPKKVRRRQSHRPFGSNSTLPCDEGEQDYVPSEEEEEESAKGRKKVSRLGGNSASVGVKPRRLNVDDLHELVKLNSELLKILPPQASFLLYNAVRRYSPMSLTRFVLSAYFMPSSPPSGTSGVVRAPRTHVLLPASLPLFASDPTAPALLLSSLSNSAFSLSSLRSLQLHGLTKLEDKSLVRLFGSIVSDRPASSGATHQAVAIRVTAARLEQVSFKGCVRIGDASLEAMVKACGKTLRYVNFDFTDIGPKGVETLIRGCPDIEVLKLGGVQGLTDSTVPPLVTRCLESGISSNPPVIPLSKIKNLRLRNTQIGDVSIGSILKLCQASLRRLDVSSTQIASGGGLEVLGWGLGLDMNRGRSEFDKRAAELATGRAPQQGEGREVRFESTTPSAVDPFPSPHQLVPAPLEKINLSGLALRPDSLAAFFYSLSYRGEEPPSTSLSVHRSSSLHTIHLACMSEKDSRARSPTPSLSEPSLVHIRNALERLSQGSLAERRQVVDGGGQEKLPEATHGGTSPDSFLSGASKAKQGTRRRCQFSKINISQNPRLGRMDLFEGWDSSSGEGEAAVHSVFENFLLFASRNCEVLDLSGIPLDRLPAPIEKQDRGGTHSLNLRILNANDTKLSDQGLERLSCLFGNLESLSLRNTNISSQVLDPIIQTCPYLERIDLTSCRGIPVKRRRNFFDQH
ncbi:hypothetical protein IE53DRAFT_389283 [Violaceomyces palustris]|uniref:Uncharacterized protein n=1 Tax=Violaceomyces palustris TaxID=1673888 RepID=A0ACD0NRS4_9BASI|nr:hypothetical protein IE53DRAFT_389283 [Violaceomyces palustris]